MGKVQVIQKSRKECKCSKCGKVIPVGSKYYKGEINFGPTIRRCESCGLESWEVTTSEWQLSSGEIVNRWEANHGLTEDTVQELYDEVENIQSEQQDRLDNMPESLQYSETGELIQSRIDACQNTMDALDSIDVDDLKSDVLGDWKREDPSREEKYEDLDFDEVMSDLEENSYNPEDSTDLQERLDEALRDAISEALNNLEE